MPQNKEHFLEFTRGLISQSSPLLVPKNALQMMSNADVTYSPGKMLKRPGYIIVGSALESGSFDITGLFNFRQSGQSGKMMATVNDSTDDDTQLFYSTGGAWTEVTAAETAWANKADINVEMESFIDHCFMVGYGDTDGFIDSASFTGTTFSTSANVTNMPKAKYIKRYRDRLYVGNCNNGSDEPFRIYFSSVPSSGSISWTTASDFIDVDFGDEITGMANAWDRLIIMNRYSGFIYDQTSLKKLFDIGCSNNRTLRTYSQFLFWANSDGVWMSTGGGRPENISGPVIDFIRNTNMDNTFAEIVDEEYWINLGTSVTVNGIDYTNVTLIYNIPSKSWRLYEHDNLFTIYARFLDSGDDFMWMGTVDGKVKKHGKFHDSTLLKDDDGTKIPSRVMTGALMFGDPSIKKEVLKILVYSEYAQGVNVRMRVMDKQGFAVTPWQRVGKLSKFIEEYSFNSKEGNFFQLEFTEFGANDFWAIYGFTALVQADEIKKN